MEFKKIALALALAMAVTPALRADEAEVSKLDVDVDGVLVQADWNADYLNESDPALKAELNGAIEGSVSFLVDVPFKKIVDNFLKPGTLGKVSPNIVKYTATKATEDENTVKYKVEEELAPVNFPMVKNMGKTKVHLDMTIFKSALKAGRLVVDWDLDRTKTNDWKRFSGHIYAVDCHNGKTMVMVASSTKSNYNILGGLRLKLAKYMLGKTKNSVVRWLEGL